MCYIIILLFYILYNDSKWSHFKSITINLPYKVDIWYKIKSKYSEQVVWINFMLLYNALHAIYFGPQLHSPFTFIVWKRTFCKVSLFTLYGRKKIQNSTRSYRSRCGCLHSVSWGEDRRRRTSDYSWSNTGENMDPNHH